MATLYEVLDSTLLQCRSNFVKKAACIIPYVIWWLADTKFVATPTQISSIRLARDGKWSGCRPLLSRRLVSYPYSMYILDVLRTPYSVHSEPSSWRRAGMCLRTVWLHRTLGYHGRSHFSRSKSKFILAIHYYDWLGIDRKLPHKWTKLWQVRW